MERIFLAAEAGQPPSHSAVLARRRGAELAWADPTLRAHEGRASRALLESAAASVAKCVGVEAATVVFAPSGASALQWAAQNVGRGALAVGAADRQVVLAVARDRAQQGGLDPEALVCGVDARGVTDVASIRASVSAGAGAIATQVGNPEVGTLQPLAELHECARQAGIPLLVDATMAAGRMPLSDDWDVLVLDARSWAGGDSAAAVVVRPGAAGRWRSEGDQALASLPWSAPWVPDIAAAAVALEEATRAAPQVMRAQHQLTADLRTALDALPQVAVHGAPDRRLPHVVGFSALYVDAEALLLQLDRAGIAVASGSACATSTGQPSHVLAAMGALTSGNLRVTLPLDVPAGALERLVVELGPAIEQLRSEAGL